MSYKFRNKFKRNVEEYKYSWKQQLPTSGKNYVLINDSQMIAETLFDAYTRGAQSHPKIAAAIKEYLTNDQGYYTLKVKCDDSGKEISHPFVFGGFMWETEEGIEVRPFEYDNSSNLNAVELNQFPSGTRVQRNKESGNTYYNPYSKTMWKHCKSRLERFGFISMNLDSKSPNPTGKETYRACDQFTSLGKILTTRDSRAKRELLSDCFLKNIGEITYSNYITKEGMRISPIVIVDENNGIRESSVYDFNLGKEVTKKTYSLTDLCVVLDIDNGKQIEYIKKCFLDMPFPPQYITQEKGVGVTKKGNSTALVILDKPVTKEERQIILKGYRYSLCCKYDVFAIDCKCTGTGYGKNPLATHNSRLQRNFYCLTNDGDYRQTLNKDRLVSWANEMIDMFESFVNASDDTFISSHEELKNSVLTYSEIIRKLNETKQELENINTKPSVFMNHVFAGMRNDQFTKIEGPIYALQYYLLKGLNCVNDERTAMDIALMIKSDIFSRYENEDNSISVKWILNKMKWIVEQDRKCLNNPEKRIEFIRNLYYQRNICIHTNECRMMLLCGYDDFKPSRFADIKEFNELGISHRYNAVQKRHGADTQAFKSMLYASCKLGASVLPILKELRNKSAEDSLYWCKQASSNKLNEVEKILPPVDMDKNRRRIVSNILLSKLSAESVIKQYEDKYGYGFEVEKADKLTSTSSSFWGFSLNYSKKFLNISNANAKSVYHIALYTNALCSLILEFGINNEGCAFKDIKPFSIRTICKNLYNRFSVNTSIVHHIGMSIKDKAKTPDMLYREICSMNTKEIANRALSIAMKDLGLSDVENEKYLGHQYRVGETATGDIRNDLFNLLESTIRKATTNLEQIRTWISHDLMSQIKKMIESFKSENEELYNELYKAFRTIITDYVTGTLKLPAMVTKKFVTKKMGLVSTKVAIEEGLDGLVSYVGNFCNSILEKCFHLRIVNGIV